MEYLNSWDGFALHQCGLHPWFINAGPMEKKLLHRRGTLSQFDWCSHAWTHTYWLCHGAKWNFCNRDRSYCGILIDRNIVGLSKIILKSCTRWEMQLVLDATVSPWASMLSISPSICCVKDGWSSGGLQWLWVLGLCPTSALLPCGMDSLIVSSPFGCGVFGIWSCEWGPGAVGRHLVFLPPESNMCGLLWQLHLFDSYWLLWQKLWSRLGSNAWLGWSAGQLEPVHLAAKRLLHVTEVGCYPLVFPLVCPGRPKSSVWKSLAALASSVSALELPGSPTLTCGMAPTVWFPSAAGVWEGPSAVGKSHGMACKLMGGWSSGVSIAGCFLAFGSCLFFSSILKGFWRPSRWLFEFSSLAPLGKTGSRLEQGLLIGKTWWDQCGSTRCACNCLVWSCPEACVGKTGWDLIWSLPCTSCGGCTTLSWIGLLLLAKLKTGGPGKGGVGPSAVGKSRGVACKHMGRGSSCASTAVCFWPIGSWVLL